VQSSKTKNGAGGTGLGLAICREIVLAHRGKIWAENLGQRGVRFCFEIPTATAEVSVDVEKEIVEAEPYSAL
jgi:signal transduction histidine kinase